MLNIVLYEPEIPANTGNIMRTCRAFNCRLHIIEPLGFYMDDSHLRRAGMDYRENVDFTLYHDWKAFREKNQGSFYYVTRYGKNSPSDYQYEIDYSQQKKEVAFGKESTGIPKKILKSNLDRCIRIPMIAEARSLNLSNCAAICAYTVLSQWGFPDLSRTEYLKGKDFLEFYHDGQ